MTFDPVLDAINGLIAVLDGARETVEKGSTVELAGLDQQIDGICEAARSRPAGERRELADGLAKIIVALEALDTALRAQRDALKAATEKRPGPHSDRLRAAQAYGGPSDKAR